MKNETYLSPRAMRVECIRATCVQLIAIALQYHHIIAAINIAGSFGLAYIHDWHRCFPHRFLHRLQRECKAIQCVPENRMKNTKRFIYCLLGIYIICKLIHCPEFNFLYFVMWKPVCASFPPSLFLIRKKRQLNTHSIANFTHRTDGVLCARYQIASHMLTTIIGLHYIWICELRCAGGYAYS